LEIKIGWNSSLGKKNTRTGIGKNIYKHTGVKEKEAEKNLGRNFGSLLLGIGI
jgi:hypothetical protein